MKKILCSLLLSTSFCFGEIPEPYASIVQLPFDGHGWFMNADPLKVIIDQKQPQIAIEIGSWLGLSTRFIASNMPENGKLYAVDTWLGSPTESVHQQDPRLPYLYQLFLSNIIHEDLCHKIIPVRMNSLEASKALNVKADLIYLDGAHDTKSVTEDIVYWNGHLNKDGIMCGDDWGWTSVQTAVIHCANVLNKKVCSSGNFWWYE